MHNCEDKPSAVKHPQHYNKVQGIECIEVAQYFNFNLGNVIKYVWRAGSKGDVIQDLEKAKQYIDFEIQRLRTQENLDKIRQGMKS